MEQLEMLRFALDPRDRRYASWVAVAYIVSRGLAKLGVREPYTDDDR